MASMNFDISANDRASDEFLALAAAAETLQKKLDRLDGKKVEPKADLNVTAFNRRLQQLETRLHALRDVRARIDVDGAAEGRREVSALVVELRKLSNATVKLRLDAGDTKQQVTTIRDRLKAIRDVDVRIDIAGTAEAATNRLATKVMALKQLSPIGLDIRVDDTGSVATKLAALRAAVADLEGARKVRVDVDGAAPGRAEVAGLVAELKRLSDRSVKVQLNAGTAKQDVTTLRDRLRELRDANIKIDLTGNGEGKANRLSTKLMALKQLSPVRIDVRVDENDSALGKLAALQMAATGLGLTRPNVQVTADTAAALTQMTALRAMVAGLAGSSTIRVDVDGTSALTQLARIQRDLATLAGGTIRIDADTRALMTRLADARLELQRLSSLQSSPTVDADITAARIHIREIEERLHQIAARQYTANVKVDIDKTLVGRLSTLTKGLVGIGAAGATAAAGLGVVVPAAATLGGSLASLVGLLPLTVAGLGSLGLVAATVKAGFSGIGEALKNTDDAKKFAESLKELAPAGRQFATAVRDIKTSFDAVRLDVQQKLFAGWGAEVKTLGQTYLPLLRTGMGGIAVELNKTGLEIAQFGKLPSTVRDIDTIFANTGQAMAAARPMAVNLLAALKDIGVVGTSMLPELAGGWTSATARFREFIAEARRTGDLRDWIQGGLDTLRQLGSVAGNVGSVLGSVFTAAKASGADFLSTLDRVTEKVAAFFRSTEGQSTLIAFFTESRAAIDALLPGLGTLGEAAAKFIKNFAESGGLERAGQALSNLAESAAPLVASLGTLAGDTLGALATAAELAGAGLMPLLNAVVAVLGAMGPLGPAILGAAVAFTTLSKAAAGVAVLGTRMGAFAASMGASQAAAGRVTSAVTAFGKAIPIAGVALVAGGAIVDHYRQQIEDATTALATGAATAQETAAQFSEVSFDNIGRSVADTIPLLNLFVDSSFEAWQKTEEGARKATAAMSPLQLAQRDVTAATKAYNEALASNDPARIAAAQQELAAAHSRVTVETQKASDATKTLAEKQQDLVSSAQSAIGSMLDLEAALRDVDAAQTAANEAAKKYGVNSKEAAAATDEFVRKADAAAQAAQKQAETQARAAGATDAATVGTNAYGAALLQQAANASGPAQQALLGYIGKLDDATLAALSAGAEATGFATQVLKLPNGKTVKVAIDPETGKIVATQQLLDAMQDKTIVINGNSVPAEMALSGVLAAIQAGKAEVTINGKTMPVQEALRTVLAQIGTATGTVNINGQAVQAQDVLTAYLAAVNSGSATVMINGNPVPADQVLTALLGRTNTATATYTIDGDPTLANGKVTQSIKFADGSTGVLTFDGNNIPANGQVTATVKYANGQTATIPITAKDAGAMNTARLIKANIDALSATIKISSAVSGVVGPAKPAGGGVMGYAGGGLVAQRSNPNLAPIRASRGYVVPGYAPGRDTVPAILSRGEAVLVPELVRMLGARRILAANAEASGGRKPSIVGNIASLMDGSVGRNRPNLRSLRTLAFGVPQLAGRAGVTRDELSARAPARNVIGALVAQSAAAGAGSSAAIAALHGELAGLRAETRAQTTVVGRLGDAIREARPITINNQRADPMETLRAAQLAARFTTR